MLKKGQLNKGSPLWDPRFLSACKNKGSWTVEAKNAHLRARTLIVCTAQHLASYSVFFISMWAIITSSF